MKKISIAACVIVMASNCVAQHPPVTAAAGTATARAITYEAFRITAADRVDPRAQRRALAAAAERFVASLAAAAAAATPAQAEAARAAEGDAIEAKLLAIAIDRSEHPERFREIHEMYVEQKFRPSVAQRPPNPQPRHTTEAYRLAWELYLLMPRPDDAASGYLENAADAVAAIGNPASAVTLGHMVDVSLQPEARHTAEAAARQRLAIKTLARMPSAPAADALLDAIGAIERTESAAPQRWSPRAYTAELLAELPLPKIEAWRTALTAAAQRRPAAAPLLRGIEQMLERKR